MRPTRWTILSLLTGFSIISYLQRMNISVAAKYMMPELGLTEVQMGQIFSSFMLGYALFQLPAGILGDRLGPRLVLGVAAGIWALTTLLTGLVPGSLVSLGFGAFVSILVLRFILGIGVAATYPVAARAVANWMRPGETAVSNAIVISGVALGSALTPPFVAWMMVAIGWRESFYVSALIALAIGVLWWTLAADAPPGESRQPGPGSTERSPDHARGAGLAGLWGVLNDRNIRVISISYFFEGYVLYVFVFWLYLYLVDIRGFDLLEAGFFTGLPWLVAAAFTPLGGRVCDWLSRRFGRLGGSRINVLFSYTIASAFLVAGATAEGALAAIAGLALSVAFLMSAEGAFWSSTIEIAGEHSGAACGLLNTVGNLGGVASTALIPVIAASFGWAFALYSSAAIAMLGAGMWLLVKPAPSLGEREVQVVGNRIR